MSIKYHTFKEKNKWKEKVSFQSNSKAKDVEKEGEVKIDVDGEVFPSVLEEDGAEYTEKSFQFDDIVGYARTNEGTRLVKIQWSPSWIDASMVDDQDFIDRQFMDNFDKVSIATKKTHRGCRGGRGKNRGQNGPKIVGVDV